MNINLNLLKNLENKTIVIIGSSGMLGSAFKEILSKLKGKSFYYFDHSALDVTNRGKVLSLAKLNPEIIIHCAAKVDVDFCEKNPEKCYNIQVQGTKNVIELAEISKSKILYPQSFLIFDGAINPVTEKTFPNPLSVYGKCKLEAEKLILLNSDKHLIIRMGGMFGGSEKDKNFIGKFSKHLVECINNKKKLIDVGDRVWQPTYTLDLAYNSLILLSKKKSGIYNMASHGNAEFFDIANEIVKKFNLPIIINKISSDKFIENAKRPNVVLIYNKKLESENLDFQRDWKESLDEYLNNGYFVSIFNMKSIVLEPFKDKFLGNMKNRIVMSAMTRNFSDHTHLCTDKMMEYYKLRAKNDVALILTEGVIIHPSADGYNNVPHMWNDAQSESWEKTTQAVHQYNTKIFCQLWHCGRISHQDYTGGALPVSSTDKAAEGINRQNNKPYAVPHRLTKEEILRVYDMFVHSTELALKAGFDGVELHFGHGYLIDQFFDSRINDRKDSYGGDIKNRCRFALELTELMIKKFGQNRIMVRISPSRDMRGIYDWPDLDKMLNYLIPAFNKIGLKMLDISCANANYFNTSGRIILNIRKIWQHLIIGGASLTLDEANKEVKDKYLDMVTWGRMILANPDFVNKLRNNVPLVAFDREMLKRLI